MTKNSGIFVVIVAHLRYIPKVKHHGLYVLVLSRGALFCDAPHLHHSHNKLPRTTENG